MNDFESNFTPKSIKRITQVSSKDMRKIYIHSQLAGLLKDIYAAKFGTKNRVELIQRIEEIIKDLPK